MSPEHIKNTNAHAVKKLQARSRRPIRRKPMHRTPWRLALTPALMRDLKRTELAMHRLPPDAIAKLEELDQLDDQKAHDRGFAALLRPYKEAVTEQEIDEALWAERTG